jgi:hypothetical protein
MMLAQELSAPNWKPTSPYRLGERYRHNPERFVFIAGWGWFVHTRGEYQFHHGIEVQSGVTGPFKTQAHARLYLERFILNQNR